MGQRAHWVIADGAGWELRRSPNAAPTLELDLLAGPGHATDIARAAQPASRWMAEPWCESAALVDHERGVLLWYSTHLPDYDYRVAALAALRALWPGWRVRWAYEGLHSLRTHLGLPSAPAGVDPDPDLPRRYTPGTAVEWGLVTVADGGAVRAYAVTDSSPAEIVALGPRLLDLLPPEARVTRCAQRPDWGAHLDTAQRTIGFWTTTTFDGAPAAVPDTWPGWRGRVWGDRLHLQRDRAAGAVALPPCDRRSGLRALGDALRQATGLPGRDRSHALAVVRDLAES